MRRANGKLAALSLGLAFSSIVFSSTVWALEEKFDATRKFARGWANVLTSIFEIPIQISKVYKEEGIVAASFWGTASGIRAAAARSAAGVMEVFTFPFALRDVGYDPIVWPEFLFNLREEP